MVTVIIPALNEEKTIRKVMELVRKSPLVSEILVIDDKSLDDTINHAKKQNKNLYQYNTWKGGFDARWHAMAEKRDNSIPGC